MRFRIVKYYDRFQAQVYKNGEYIDIGPPNGCATVALARIECENYKFRQDDKIVDEFEL